MKHLFSILAISVFIFFISCNSNPKSNPDEIYEYIEETVELNDSLKQRIGDWAEEGVICYGIIVLLDSDGTIKNGPWLSRLIIYCPISGRVWVRFPCAKACKTG